MFICINEFDFLEEPPVLNFLVKKDSVISNKTLNNASPRRRSSWSVMKNLIKGLNGLMSPQVHFIKNEVLYNTDF